MRAGMKGSRSCMNLGFKNGRMERGKGEGDVQGALGGVCGKIEWGREK